jgi:hypothetical protein
MNMENLNFQQTCVSIVTYLILTPKTYMNGAAMKMSNNQTKREIKTRTKKPTFKKDILKNLAC